METNEISTKESISRASETRTVKSNFRFRSSRELLEENVARINDSNK